MCLCSQTDKSIHCFILPSAHQESHIVLGIDAIKNSLSLFVSHDSHMLHTSVIISVLITI